MNTDKLRDIYEKIYKDGKESFFSRFVDGKDISETNQIVWSAINWKDKTVVDVGCGTGETAAGIAALGARRVFGIDYAEAAVREAKRRHVAENLAFVRASLADWSESADVLVSCGTLEHTENPKTDLRRMIDLVKGRGTIILTCPYFINIRGFVWMSLALLLDVPMSLTDRHFISPFDIEEWLVGTPMRLETTRFFDYERANGKVMLEDMRKRLTNALRDANLPNDGVERTIQWLAKVIELEKRTFPGRMGGANSLYLITADRSS